MILTCPSCGTRYSVDEAKFPPAGRQVRCAKCGHAWHQEGPAPSPAPEPVREEEIAPQSAPQPAAAEPVSAPRPEEAGEEPLRPRAYAATSSYGAPGPAERMNWTSRLAVAAGWAALIVVVLLIGYSAVRYRQEITVIWPQSAGVYNSLGMKVNNHGIDFDAVAYHRESEDGQVVLAVTGKIVNRGNRELPVPQTVRVILSDAANHELYRWSFTPSVQTLKPGQSVPFLTRLSSPPSAARHLEVIFAKDGA